MKQYILTPAAGKRLIARALSQHPVIKNVIKSGTLVVVAGTTNGFIAEEILRNMGVQEEFPRKRFFRGISLPPSHSTTSSGRLPHDYGFPGDFILHNGNWIKGKTILDFVEDLREGDVILKGANALDPLNRRAAVLIGDYRGGTVISVLQALVGRRVRVIVPVGLEKRIYGNLDSLAVKLNAPGFNGLRLLPIPGEVFTEIDAINLLTGATAELFASGGVCGAEGSVWLAVYGTEEQLHLADTIIKSIAHEPQFCF